MRGPQLVTSLLVRWKFIDVKLLPTSPKTDANGKNLPQNVKKAKKLDEPEQQQMVLWLMPTGLGAGMNNRLWIHRETIGLFWAQQPIDLGVFKPIAWKRQIFWFDRDFCHHSRGRKEVIFSPLKPPSFGFNDHCAFSTTQFSTSDCSTICNGI